MIVKTNCETDGSFAALAMCQCAMSPHLRDALSGPGAGEHEVRALALAVEPAHGALVTLVGAVLAVVTHLAQ